MMQRRQKFVIGYFIFFSVLTIIALIPGGTFLVSWMPLKALYELFGLPTSLSNIQANIQGFLVLLFSIPGLLVAASPTVLLYSVSLIPLWFVLTGPHHRLWRIVAAALIPIAIAIAPGMISFILAKASINEVSQANFARSPAVIEAIAIPFYFSHGTGFPDDDGRAYIGRRKIVVSP